MMMNLKICLVAALMIIALGTVNAAKDVEMRDGTADVVAAINGLKDTILLQGSNVCYMLCNASAGPGRSGFCKRDCKKKMVD